MVTLVPRHDHVRLFGRRVLTVVILLLVVIASFGVWDVYKKERASASLRVEAQTALADLSAREAKLQDNIAQLQTERGKEEIVRQQYEMGKEGEHLIVIVEPDEATTAPATTTIFQKIKKAFTWW
jgi:cell division protein FtsB